MEGEIIKLEEKKTKVKSGEKHTSKITVETSCGHKIIIEGGPDLIKGKDRGHDVSIVLDCPQTTLEDHT